VTTFPLGTMIVNVTGCFVLGLLAVYLGWVCGRALHGGTP
jgi:fluoride ion exporter CrcB/FEX